jgi:hypothetical protein
MKSPNQYLSPKSDAYEKALGGIDLCLKQNDPMNEKTDSAYHGLQQNLKQNSGFFSNRTLEKEKTHRATEVKSRKLIFLTHSSKHELFCIF